MAIKSKTANLVVMAVGVILLLWAASAGLESAVRGVRLGAANAVIAMLIAGLGWWCLRGALKNLKSGVSAESVGRGLQAAVAADIVAIPVFVVGTLSVALLAERHGHGPGALGALVGGGLLASLAAAPVLVVVWLLTVRRRSNGAA